MKKDKIKLIHGDSYEFCKSVPDKFYDLLICDPPYGIGMSKPAGLSQKYSKVKLVDKAWDTESPSHAFFEEMFRVSKNQIIFGANHLIRKIAINSSCWIIWDKRCGIVPPRTYADAELAWTSFDKPTRIARFLWDGFLTHGDKVTRIHPTQKPVELYDWILRHYAKEGDQILDPFGGSFSSAVAGYYKGREMEVIEIDLDYFIKGSKRFNEETQQTKMF
jgi:site-specific DNA-methyltransferase (adenine-specific)